MLEDHLPGFPPSRRSAQVEQCSAVSGLCKILHSPTRASADRLNQICQQILEEHGPGAMCASALHGAAAFFAVAHGLSTNGRPNLENGASIDRYLQYPKVATLLVPALFENLLFSTLTRDVHAKDPHASEFDLSNLLTARTREIRPLLGALSSRSRTNLLNELARECLQSAEGESGLGFAEIYLREFGINLASPAHREALAPSCAHTLTTLLQEATRCSERFFRLLLKASPEVVASERWPELSSEFLLCSLSQFASDYLPLHQAVFLPPGRPASKQVQGAVPSLAITHSLQDLNHSLCEFFSIASLSEFHSESHPSLLAARLRKPTSQLLQLVLDLERFEGLPLNWPSDLPSRLHEFLDTANLRELICEDQAQRRLLGAEGVVAKALVKGDFPQACRLMALLSVDTLGELHYHADAETDELAEIAEESLTRWARDRRALLTDAPPAQALHRVLSDIAAAGEAYRTFVRPHRGAVDFALSESLRALAAAHMNCDAVSARPAVMVLDILPSSVASHIAITEAAHCCSLLQKLIPRINADLKSEGALDLPGTSLEELIIEHRAITRLAGYLGLVPKNLVPLSHEILRAFHAHLHSQVEGDNHETPESYSVSTAAWRNKAYLLLRRPCPEEWSHNFHDLLNSIPSVDSVGLHARHEVAQVFYRAGIEAINAQQYQRAEFALSSSFALTFKDGGLLTAQMKKISDKLAAVYLVKQDAPLARCFVALGAAIERCLEASPGKPSPSLRGLKEVLSAPELRAWKAAFGYIFDEASLTTSGEG